GRKSPTTSTWPGCLESAAPFAARAAASGNQPSRRSPCRRPPPSCRACRTRPVERVAHVRTEHQTWARPEHHLSDLPLAFRALTSLHGHSPRAIAGGECPEREVS